MKDLHPIHLPKGYQINTRPTERFVNYLLMEIKAGHHGSVGEGAGRIGKTSAIRYLCDQNQTWLSKLPGGGIAAHLRLPLSARRSDDKFFETLAEALGMDASERPANKKKRQRMVNYVLARCGAAGVNTMVLFIDNAHRLSRDELDYLADLVDDVEQAHIHLFLALIRQSDANGVNVSAKAKNYPSNISGRFFLGEHRYTGLLGLPDVEHALQRFHVSAFWPKGSGISFVQHFAPAAVASGWTPDQQASFIEDIRQQVRAEGKLRPSDEWPMKTFTGMVKFLLTEVAGNDRSFRQFTEDHIRVALKVCGYMTLEYVRAGLVPDETRP